jgi:hypothetical protein
VSALDRVRPRRGPRRFSVPALVIIAFAGTAEGRLAPARAAS